MYSYLFWLGLAIGYPLLQVWLATEMNWVGTPERELLVSALTRFPLLLLIGVTYRPGSLPQRKGSDAVAIGGAVSAVLAIALGWLIFSKGATYAASSGTTVAYFVLAMLVVAATEEYLFRGQLLLARLRAGASRGRVFWAATVAFAAVHAVNGLIYAGSSWRGILSQVIYALLVGALLGWLALRLRRIWPLVLLHAGLNIGLATGRLREPVFAPESQLSTPALVVMVLALGLAGWTAYRHRRSLFSAGEPLPRGERS